MRFKKTIMKRWKFVWAGNPYEEKQHRHDYRWIEDDKKAIEWIKEHYILKLKLRFRILKRIQHQLNCLKYNLSRAMGERNDAIESVKEIKEIMSKLTLPTGGKE